MDKFLCEFNFPKKKRFFIFIFLFFQLLAAFDASFNG